VDPAILARYQPVQSGELAWDKPALEEKGPVDPNNDSSFKVGAGGSWYVYGAGNESSSTTWGTNDVPLVGQLPVAQSTPANASGGDDINDSPEARAFQPVLDAYKAQHGGQEPDDPAELIPYLKTPADTANFLALLKKAELEASPEELAQIQKLRVQLQK
jgi:hypothetical protein